MGIKWEEKGEGQFLNFFPNPSLHERILLSFNLESD